MAVLTHHARDHLEAVVELAPRRAVPRGRTAQEGAQQPRLVRVRLGLGLGLRFG